MNDTGEDLQGLINIERRARITFDAANGEEAEDQGTRESGILEVEDASNRGEAGEI